MAGSGDIRAGRAFVELGTDDSKLIAGLKVGLTRVRAFASQAASIGRSVALFGGAVTGGLALLGKSFGDTGAQLSRLRNQTGLSAEALSALARSAADNDVPLQTVAKAMTALQKSMVHGGEDIDQALARMGLRLADLRALKPDQVLGLIADRLPAIEDEAKRTATALTLLGRGGAELLPLFARGSRGLDEAAAAARRAGDALDDQALAAAEQADDAFDELTASVKGLRNEVAQALVPALVPLVNGLSAVVQGLRAWVEANPEAARGVLGLAVGATTLGAAVWALSAAFSALGAAASFALSPLGLMLLPSLAVAGAFLAISDAAGVTKLGIGDLFNSVRIGGQGLATVLAKGALEAFRVWQTLVTSIESGWDTIATGAQNAATVAVAAMLGMARKVLSVFGTMLAGVESVIHKLAQVWNETLGPVAGEIKVGSVGSSAIDKLAARLGVAEGAALGSVAQRTAELEARQRQRGETLRGVNIATGVLSDRLDQADPDDGGTGIGFDPSRAKRGIVKLGSSILDGVMSVLDDIAGKLPGSGGVTGAGLADALGLPGLRLGAIGQNVEPSLGGVRDGVQELERSQRRLDSATTFNADFAARLGIGSSVEERVARATEEQVRVSRSILDELRHGASGALYGV